MWSRSSRSPYRARDAGARIDGDSALAVGALDVSLVLDVHGVWSAEDVAVRPDRHDLTAVVEPEVPTALVNEAVMMPAQLDEIRQIVGAVLRTMADVMNVHERACRIRGSGNHDRACALRAE